PGEPERTDPPPAGVPGCPRRGRTGRRAGGGADRLRRTAREKESPAQPPGRLAVKPLIWKECRENLKWAVLPSLLIFGSMGLFGAFKLLDKGPLFLVSLFAAAFGAALGFLQVFFESRGDKRSLLLHRPLSRSQIFLGKALAGVGLYLLALGIPFACGVVL